MSEEDSSDPGGLADIDSSGSEAVLICNSAPGASQFHGDVESDSLEWEDCDEAEVKLKKEVQLICTDPHLVIRPDQSAVLKTVKKLS